MAEIFNSKLTAAVLEQNENRRSWKQHDTFHAIRKMFWEEYAEYREAKELCMLGADPYELASEAGDLGYLYIKLMDVTGGSVDADIEQLVQQVHDECTELGIDMMQAVWFKVWRNEIKYVQAISNNGFGYEEGVALSKQQYKLIGGDKMYYYVYMMLTEDIENQERASISIR